MSTSKKQQADLGIIPGEFVMCLSDFYRTMEVEVLDVVDVLVEEQIQTYYLFQDARKVPSLVGIGNMSAVEDGRRYHIQAKLIKSFGEGQNYPTKEEALASLRH